MRIWFIQSLKDITLIFIGLQCRVALLLLLFILLPILRMFTPQEPFGRQDGINTMPDFPSGDISFLLDIPAIRSFKPISQHGPHSQPGIVRIKKGDEGLSIRLVFDFM